MLHELLGELQAQKIDTLDPFPQYSEGPPHIEA